MDAKDYRKTICYGVGTQKELSITTKLITKEVQKMSWNYNDWIDRVESMSEHGTAEGMANLIDRMRWEGASEDDIVRLDHLHNRSFSVL